MHDTTIWIQLTMRARPLSTWTSDDGLRQAWGEDGAGSSHERILRTVSP